MTTKTLSKNDLAQFTGSENWYRHGINRNVLYTDGAQHVAEHGGAYSAKPACLLSCLTVNRFACFNQFHRI
jgi:hypothetical protein